MTSKKTTRYYVPHPQEAGCSIAGDLEQVDPELPTQGRKIALILHGVLGHKDYLFQKRLAKLLPMDSFRFDFRGNHETPGNWNMAGFEEDLQDLSAVVAFLTSQLGYSIDMLVGHSRGSIVAFKWICTAPEGPRVSAFVNVAGRYRMERVRKRLTIYQPAIDEQGYYEWKARVAGKEKIAKIYGGDVERFAAWDTSFVWDQFPQRTHALTIQGLVDEILPPYDAFIYARALSTRSPGTHTLHMVEDADHNFTGKSDDVNDAIVEWLVQVRNGTVKGGIHGTGVRGKL
ncbi:ectomycorrhiza-regulated esterase [Gautieria morchelliformis]|nr:ectomycorrhiza-regulated esterase [Gautieria morchelliformis]